MLSRTILIFVGFALVGCSSLVKVPEARSEIHPNEALAEWGMTLASYVDEKGRVDFLKLSKNRQNLVDYIQFVSKNGPKSTPQLFLTKEAKLAYYINTYNALAMYDILEADIPESLTGLTGIRFFKLRKFRVDGDEMNLESFRDLIRQLGDERVHFALNFMVRGCARLPKMMFSADALEAELEDQARVFFNDDKNVHVEPNEKRIYFSELLKIYREDFLKKAISLTAYANRYRNLEEKFPEDFTGAFKSIDWTVNQQPIATDYIK